MMTAQAVPLLFGGEIGLKIFRAALGNAAAVPIVTTMGRFRPNGRDLTAPHKGFARIQ
jgi:hypothetical protein